MTRLRIICKNMTVLREIENASKHMLKIGYSLLFAIFAALVSCAPPKAGSAINSNISTPVEMQSQSPNSASTKDGSAIYADNCARCHGDHGQGAKKGIPLNSGHALHHSTEEYIEQVNDGTENKMPAFNAKLSSEDVIAVVEHVRKTLQSGAAHK